MGRRSDPSGVVRMTLGRAGGVILVRVLRSTAPAFTPPSTAVAPSAGASARSARGLGASINQQAPDSLPYRESDSGQCGSGTSAPPLQQGGRPRGYSAGGAPGRAAHPMAGLAGGDGNPLPARIGTAQRHLPHSASRPHRLSDPNPDSDAGRSAEGVPGIRDPGGGEPDRVREGGRGLYRRCPYRRFTYRLLSTASSSTAPSG
jgi:hypothetical protein